MFSEYAVDPTLLAILEASRSIRDRFSWKTGRVIAEYPVRWQRLAYDAITAAQAGPVKKMTMKENVRRLKPVLVRRLSEGWDEKVPWVDQALAEHGRQKFHALVVAHADTASDPQVAWDADDMDSTHWAEPSAVIGRTADAMARAFAILISSSRRVLLVDPYFDPDSARYRATLSALMDELRHPPHRGPLPAFEIHTSVKKFLRKGETPDDAQLRDYASRYLASCRRVWPTLVPRDLSLCVNVWHERQTGQRLHNRYVLTELGGVAPGVGLDAAPPGSVETDDLHRLTLEQHGERWAHFTGAAGAYERLAGPESIVGVAAAVGPVS